MRLGGTEVAEREVGLDEQRAPATDPAGLDVVQSEESRPRSTSSWATSTAPSTVLPIVTRAESSSCAARATLSSAAASAGYRSPRSSRIQLRIRAPIGLPGPYRRHGQAAARPRPPPRRPRRFVPGARDARTTATSRATTAAPFPPRRNAPAARRLTVSPSSTRSTASSPQGTAARSSPTDASSSSVARSMLVAPSSTSSRAASARPAK